MCGDMSVKKLRFVLSPELADGASSQVVIDPSHVADAVREWASELLQYGGDGESCSITTRFMTDKEFEALPEL